MFRSITIIGIMSFSTTSKTFITFCFCIFFRTMYIFMKSSTFLSFKFFLAILTSNYLDAIMTRIYFNDICKKTVPSKTNKLKIHQLYLTAI